MEDGGEDVITMRKKRAVLATLVTASFLAGGCNWLLPFVFLGEHKRKIAPEYDRLEGSRLAVVVWAEPETLFDYPHVRLELGAFIGDRIRANVEQCDVVDQFAIEEFMERDLDAAADPRKVGTEFEADKVVYVELLRFQIRDASSPDLLQARVDAGVSVYDLYADPDEINRFVLDPVSVTYPEGQAAVMSARAAQLVRQNTYELFSETVARKFYEHRVDM